MGIDLFRNLLLWVEPAAAVRLHQRKTAFLGSAKNAINDEKGPSSQLLMHASKILPHDTEDEKLDAAHCGDRDHQTRPALRRFANPYPGVKRVKNQNYARGGEKQASVAGQGQRSRRRGGDAIESKFQQAAKRILCITCETRV